MAEAAKTGSEAFGEMLREARERLGMSRRDLAEATGLSYPYISQLETGYRTPSSPAMRSLADALGLRVDTLFEAIPPSASRETISSREPDAGREPKAPAPEPVRPRMMSAPRATAPPRPSAPAAPAPTTAVPPAVAAGAPPPPMRAPSPVGGGAAGGTAAGAGGAPPHGTADYAPPPAPVAAVAGGWFDNAQYSAAAGRATPDAGARLMDPEPTPDIGRIVENATNLLVSLPPGERLDALALVQSRVVQSVVEDEVRERGAG